MSWTGIGEEARGPRALPVARTIREPPTVVGKGHGKRCFWGTGSINFWIEATDPSLQGGRGPPDFCLTEKPGLQAFDPG